MNMENDTRLEGFVVIHAYTRAQAIEDGVLVDLSDLAREAGYRFPVAVTRGVLGVLNPTKELEAEGQDMAGRAWDMLAILRYGIRSASRTDEVRFAPLFLREPGQKVEPVEMWAKCGPGDDAEPVITVMLKGED
ncbi:MAG: hypothetical protein M0D55_06660 [Elusimicrobiota bacterium]|nr:MAG: hypothetical protein M0D55_06660 [Elusimicrobiota bacterium]